MYLCTDVQMYQWNSRFRVGFTFGADNEVIKQPILSKLCIFSFYSTFHKQPKPQSALRNSPQRKCRGIFRNICISDNPISFSSSNNILYVKTTYYRKTHHPTKPLAPFALSALSEKIHLRENHILQKPHPPKNQRVSPSKI